MAEENESLFKERKEMKEEYTERHRTRTALPEISRRAPQTKTKPKRQCEDRRRRAPHSGGTHFDRNKENFRKKFLPFLFDKEVSWK